MTELYLIAHLAGRIAAISGDQVQSVVDLGPIVAVPLAPPAVRGLAALRSRVVTVIDPRIALGVPGTTKAQRAVISVVEGNDYALLVDALDDVAPFKLHPLAPGLVLTRGWHEAARGMIERDGEPILAIDLQVLIPGVSQALAA